MKLFIVNYNNVLREITGDSLDNVIERTGCATSVSELEEVSIEEEVNLIETALGIELFGNPDEASIEQVEVLAQSLQEIFNALNGWWLLEDQICDPLEVISVEAELDTTHARRNLQIGTGNSFFGTGNSSFGTAKSPFISSPVLLRFDIILQC
jgi:hypothetical protein